MSSHDKHHGACFCGAIEVETTGDPEGMGYCHCESCRRWSAGPINAFTLWKPDAVSVTKGVDNLASFSKNPSSVRRWCKICGGHVLSEHPGLGLVDVYAAVLAGFAFAPGVHVNYADSVLPIRDGLPKMKDFPSELGGSGEQLAE